jgi:hypothetical protein
VRDIEDIVTLGRQSCVCPYYATRKAVKQAHVGVDQFIGSGTLSSTLIYSS